MKPIVEKKWEYKGYRCVVLFQPMCFRCGYVEIPESSKYFNVDYNNIPVDVHGGLTYGRGYLAEVSKLEDGKYWIGWDYAHYMDGNDYESGLEYYKDDKAHCEYIRKTKEIISCIDGLPCTQLDVERDCIKVVDQLIFLEGGVNND